jgi:hypothetical protein
VSADDVARRREEAREKAAYHAEAAAREQRRDAAAAAVLVERFAEQARAAGLVSSELRARPYSGRGRFRTGVRGWYVKRDGSLGVGEDGRWYVLVVPPSVRARFTGVDLHPSDASVQVGKGARDGESIELEVLLRQRLEAGDDFPRP